MSKVLGIVERPGGTVAGLLGRHLPPAPARREGGSTASKAFLSALWRGLDPVVAYGHLGLISADFSPCAYRFLRHNDLLDPQ